MSNVRRKILDLHGTLTTVTPVHCIYVFRSIYIATQAATTTTTFKWKKVFVFLKDSEKELGDAYGGIAHPFYKTQVRLNQ